LSTLGRASPVRHTGQAGIRGPAASTLLGVLAIAAVSLLLRTYQLGARSLWLDEAISLWEARQPLTQLPAILARFDEHPPLYFALLHAWRVGGESEVWLRLLSVLFSTLAVVVAALLGHALVGRGAALLAALLVGLSPAQVHHAQDARMYALVCLLGLGMTYAAVMALDSRTATRLPPWSVVWGVLTALLAATSHSALLLGATLPGAALTGLALGRSMRGLRAVLVAMAVALALWAPVAGILLQQVGTVGQRFWIPPPTLEFVRSVVLEATLGQVPPPSQIQLSDPIAITSVADVPLWLIALPRAEPLRQVSLFINRWQEWLYLGLLALLAYGTFAVWRRAGIVAALVIGGAVLLPPLGLAVVSLAKPLLIARAIAASASVGLVLAAVACVALPRVARPVVVSLLLVWELLALGQHWWYAGGEDWQGTAAQLVQQSRPGELVLINSRWAQLALEYYLDKDSPSRLVLRGVPVDYSAQGKPEPTVTRDDEPLLRRLTEGQDRVWLVLSHDDDADPEKITRKTLEATFKCFDVKSRPGVTLILFERCSG
jgi:mannosyltransferase